MDYVTVYHGTIARNCSTIRAQGLIVCHGSGADAWAERHNWGVARSVNVRPPSIYVSTSAKWAAQFAATTAEDVKDRPLVLRICVPLECFERNFIEDELSNNLDESTTNYRTEKTIPPEWITGELRDVPLDFRSFGEPDDLLEALFMTLTRGAAHV